MRPKVHILVAADFAFAAEAAAATLEQVAIHAYPVHYGRTAAAAAEVAAWCAGIPRDEPVGIIGDSYLGQAPAVLPDGRRLTIYRLNHPFELLTDAHQIDAWLSSRRLSAHTGVGGQLAAHPGGHRPGDARRGAPLLRRHDAPARAGVQCERQRGGRRRRRGAG
jgi:hypothetical protein